MRTNKLLSSFIFSILLLAGIPVADAAVSLAFPPAGGPLYDLDYGPSGGIASLDGFYTGPFGVQTPDVVEASVAGLSASYEVVGDGTDLMQFRFLLENTSASATSGLGFLVRVNPDGTGFSSPDLGQVTFPAQTAGEAAAFEIDDEFSGNIGANVVGGVLDDTNSCVSACDLVYALSWEIGALAPGQVALVNVGLSDVMLTLSGRYLDAIAADDAQSTLRLSGTATVVPLPGALPLLSGALAGILLTLRRRIGRA